LTSSLFPRPSSFDTRWLGWHQLSGHPPAGHARCPENNPPSLPALDTEQQEQKGDAICLSCVGQQQRSSQQHSLSANAVSVLEHASSLILGFIRSFAGATAFFLPLSAGRPFFIVVAIIIPPSSWTIPGTARACHRSLPQQTVRYAVVPGTLKLPAASCRESSILKVVLFILIAHQPRSKLRGTRSLLDSGQLLS
jgi:hypothetical protein